MDKLNQPLIQGVIFTELKKISVAKGAVYHGVKKGDIGFKNFGELYFSFIDYEETKGWKKHNRMVLNLIVPVGTIDFFIHREETKTTIKITLGENNYGRLSIEPGLWVAFSGKNHEKNMLVNIASIKHSPDEIENADLNTFPFL